MTFREAVEATAEIAGAYRLGLRALRTGNLCSNGPESAFIGR